MEYLFSNFNPLNTRNNTFTDTFYDLMAIADEMNIAVGYITADSLSELQKIVEYNKYIGKLNLTIGMHYFDKFTRLEYQAAMNLNRYLQENKKGKVMLVDIFRFHGKLYSFLKSGNTLAGIIGSNNLSSIIDSNSRVYEAAVVTNNYEEANEMYNFICQLNLKAAKDISDVEIHSFRENNSALKDQEDVNVVDDNEFANCILNLTGRHFNIPIKASERHQKSNLNVFFGKGREDSRGVIRPRHWYEVEIIVPKSITSCMGYPTNHAVFDVITDDKWKFKCTVNGDFSKNFRSEGDLKILGRWLKGRLESAGVLNVGEHVTEDTLRRYGRDNFTLIETVIPDLWYLDFGVRK